jgi:hypothetical protein
MLCKTEEANIDDIITLLQKLDAWRLQEVYIAAVTLDTYQHIKSDTALKKGRFLVGCKKS